MSRGDRRIGWRGTTLALAAGLLALAGCAADGGGRGTGIGASTISGNIAPATSAAADAAPICPALNTSAMVSVRNTDLAAPIEADCSFLLEGVPPGDVILDFEVEAETTSLAVNNVPPDTVIVLTDVRLRETRTDVAAVVVRPADPSVPVKARIVADPMKGEAPLAVRFAVNAAEDTPLRVEWKFGDGSPVSTEPNPTHVYVQPGEYVVRLRLFAANAADAVNAGALDVFTAISVRPPVTEPGDVVVDLAAVPPSGAPPLPVEFTARVKNGADPLSYRWVFGDGAVLDDGGPVARHTFSAKGEFLVVVTVRDAARVEAGDAFLVVVEPPLLSVRPTPTVAFEPTLRATAVPATATGTPTRDAVRTLAAVTATPAAVATRPSPAATSIAPVATATANTTAPAATAISRFTPTAGTTPNVAASTARTPVVAETPPAGPSAAVTAGGRTATPAATADPEKTPATADTRPVSPSVETTLAVRTATAALTVTVNATVAPTLDARATPSAATTAPATAISRSTPTAGTDARSPTPATTRPPAPTTRPPVPTVRPPAPVPPVVPAPAPAPAPIDSVR